MKPTLKFVTVPLSFWNCDTLSLTAKWVAITIDTYTDSPNGVAMGVKAIQNATNLSAKEVKAALIELKDKGALTVSIGEDGEKLIKPHLYKDTYIPNKETSTIGDTPTNSEPLDWEDISAKWKESCPDLPPVTRWTPSRKRRLKSSMKQAAMTVAELYKVFAIVGATPFLCGKNDKEWYAGFDWVTGNATHLTKIYEGSYSHTAQERQAYEYIMSGRKPKVQKDNLDSVYR